DPKIIGSGASNNVNIKSADGGTTVVMLATVLSARLGSVTREETVTRFVIGPTTNGCTTTLRVTAVSLARFPIFANVMTPLLCAKPGEAETTLALFGRMAETTTLVAVDGPKFVTEMV